MFKNKVYDILMAEKVDQKKTLKKIYPKHTS